MTIFFTLFLLITLFILELLYFRIADRCNIIDKPNHRSSHTTVTIRGGGVIFGFAALLFFFFYHFEYPYFILGLLSISAISFIDDVITLNNRIRLTVHVLSVAIMFYQLNLSIIPWWLLTIGFVFVIGTINAYNFMDGINGITGAYSLVAIGTLYYINEYVVSFTSRDFLIIITLSLLVFNYFNFRKLAKCFAGDVGSVGIAFIVLFLLLQLIIKTGDFKYVLILLIYGLDTMTTIIFRAIKKENIFEAHRAHFYQYWANERKIPHLVVSVVYAIAQLLVNLIVVLFLPSSFVVVLLYLAFVGLIFITLRFAIEGQTKLLGH